MKETREQRIEKWKLLVQERLERGISVNAFCAEKGYTEDMYYHWVNVIHKTDPSFVTRTSSGGCASQAVNPLVEISPCCLPGGRTSAGKSDGRLPAAAVWSGSVRIDLFQNADAGFLRQLLEAVGHA